MNSNSSAALEYSHLQEASVLTRAVENVVRSLVKMLVGRMSLARLQEMLRVVFVEESEKFLERERPGKKVSMTSLAILTGLDTRTLDKIRSRIKLNSIACDQKFLRGFTPGFKVLDRWLNDQDYRDALTEEPKELPISGASPSFESLASRAIKSRGLTYNSILQRLIANNMVFVTESKQTVRVNRKNLTFIGSDELDLMDIGLSSVAHLLTTIRNNLLKHDCPEQKFFQRSCWTYELPFSAREKLRTDLSDYLATVDDNSKNIIAQHEDKDTNEERITAGVSFFYFEETIPS